MPEQRHPRQQDDPIPDTLEELELDIDYWTGQLGAGLPGSNWEHWVETRLRKLARAKERSLATRDAAKVQPASVIGDARRVFVVHGRNLRARDAMFAFLRSVDLNPIEWSEAVSFTGEGSPFIGQVLDRAFSEATAVVVLITGDDVARLRSSFLTPGDPPHEKELTPQARPNVLFEAGMAFGRYPDRTILVSLGYSRPFSDVAGRNEVRISNKAEDRQALAARLRTAGCDLKTDNRTGWLNAGDFDTAMQLPDHNSIERETLKKHQSVYWRIEAGSIDGPFCPECLEHDNKLITLRHMGTMPVRGGAQIITRYACTFHAQLGAIILDELVADRWKAKIRTDQGPDRT
jgi:predicted nucleotide-binding protein